MVIFLFKPHVLNFELFFLISFINCLPLKIEHWDPGALTLKNMFELIYTLFVVLSKKTSAVSLFNACNKIYNY